MKLFKKLAAALLALTMVASMAACGSSGGSAAGSTAEAAKSDAPAAAASEAGSAPAAAAGDVDVNAAMSGKTIGYVTINGAAPWGGLIGTKLDEFVKEAGGTCKILDAQTDTAKIAEYCQQMIDASVDALVIFGGDPSANSDIAKTADEAGIPVFMAALDVSENGRQYVKACVGPDQKAMCEEIGKFIIEQNGADAGCKVVQISGVPFLDDYIQREAGFAEAMKGTNYDILEADYAYSSRSDAKTFMENHIQAEGDSIDIVMGYDDDLTMGAVAAIDEAGLTGTIKVYSITGQNDAIQAVADGKIELTVMNRADAISQEIVNAMAEVFTNGTTEYYHYTDLTYITKDNVNDYIGKGEF
ncbi:MAG: sugar ABC transporter substrate-binding protein [Oscillospiraceae bacterium]|nr:sugar ABC transporter substrate-binding protein [Oscillospiraceae bacterium]